MEEGSLLQVALDHAKTLHTSTACDSLLTNCIVLDLFPLESQVRKQKNRFLYLAEIALYSNEFFRRKGHLWHYGADGPVFGVHETECIPHLRAYCRYGTSVQDSWLAIHGVIELIRSMKDEANIGDVVALAWDVQDGQVIFIQLADLLPPWLDEDPTDQHRYACWIDCEGNLQLLRKGHITLKEALKELEQLRRKAVKTSSHPNMQTALTYWLELNVQAASLPQRTAMVLPRAMGHAFRKRPELLCTAIQAFCENIQQEGPIATEAIDLDLTKYSDWVWTVQTLPRTSYAMARTVRSSRRDWTSSPDSIPTRAGPEVKRYRRQCKMESTKHLAHALSLGVRVIAGLELLMDTGNDRSGMFRTSTSLSSLEQRILHWTRVEHRCESQRSKASGSLLENFQIGPNRANLDLSNVLKCPVFPEEAQNWTSYSNPQTSLRDQIRAMVRQKDIDANDDDEDFCIPRSDEVDSDDWMNYDLSKDGKVETIDSERDVDNLLSRFQTFLKQNSDVEGVSSQKFQGGNQAGTLKPTSVEIRPRVFMNILHSVLKGDDLQFAPVDPFFYREDYDLMDEDNEENSQEDISERKETSFRMNELMTVMDEELEARAESRRFPTSANNVSKDGNNGNTLSRSIDEDAHVLNNLMKSLDASGGGSGPVLNILKEMENQK